MPVVALLLRTVSVNGQFTLTKEQMTAYTAMNPYDRFPDGRPKVPDELLAKLKDLVIEEAYGAVRGGCGRGNAPAPKAAVAAFRISSRATGGS